MAAEIEALTVRETAQRLKLSERFVAQLIAERRLASMKIGRRRVIPVTALRDFMNRHEVVAR